MRFLEECCKVQCLRQYILPAYRHRFNPSSADTTWPQRLDKPPDGIPRIGGLGDCGESGEVVAVPGFAPMRAAMPSGATCGLPIANERLLAPLFSAGRPFSLLGDVKKPDETPVASSWKLDS
jgi:hypothetical protein